MPKKKLEENSMFYFTGNGTTKKSYLKSASFLASLNMSVNTISFEKYGDKLQKFLDDNGLDLDLRTSEGEDKGCLFTDYDHSTKAGNRPFNAMKEVKTDTASASKEQLGFNTNVIIALRKSISSSPLTSTLYVFLKGENSPSILYFDRESDSIKATEPIARLNPETYKPQKPGLWARFWHAINKNWYKEEHDTYERKMQEYTAFAGDPDKHIAGTFNATKSLFEYEVSKWPQDAIEEKARMVNKVSGENRQRLKNAPQVYDEQQARTNRIIDDLLGPNAQGSQELINANVYRENEYVPEKIDYPETKFTDHEIALLGYAAISQPDISSKREEDLNLDLTDKEKAQRNITHYTDDVFYTEGGASGRAGSGVVIKQFNDVRNIARDALKEYNIGNKEPMAKLLGDSIKMQIWQFKICKAYDVNMVHASEIMGDMMALMNKDPELADLSGLNQDDIATAKGVIRYGEINKKAILGASELADSSKNLSQQEKNMYLNDVILAEAIDAINVAEFNKSHREIEESQNKECEEIQKNAHLDPNKAINAINTLLGKILIYDGSRESNIIKKIGNDPEHALENKYLEKLETSPMMNKLRNTDNSVLIDKIAGGFKEEAEEIQTRLAPGKEPSPAKNVARDKSDEKQMDIPGLRKYKD